MWANMGKEQKQVADVYWFYQMANISNLPNSSSFPDIKAWH